MAASRAEEAIQDFRTALVYARENGVNPEENSDYDLYLGRALSSAGRVEEARAYFLNLAERAPGNATVNLELARLAARQNNVPAAMRYYTAAIYGVWETDPAVQRRDTRIEFSEFLLKNGQGTEAQAELNAMAANLPPDSTLLVQAGTLFERAGAYDQAAKQFKNALAINPRVREALLGAGNAEFHLGEYAAAANHLDRAAREGALDSSTRQTLEISRQVISLDPYAVNISSTERGSRAARAFDVAFKRLENCADGQPGSPLQQLYADAVKQRRQASEKSLLRHPEYIASVVALTFQIELEARKRCGSPSVEDQALEIIAKSHVGGTS